MFNKYFIELLGVVTILYAKLLTEGDPTVMAIIYFAMFSMAKNITTGFFTPIGSAAAFMIGRVTKEDFMYNLLAQFGGTLAVVITFLPIKAYIDAASK